MKQLLGPFVALVLLWLGSAATGGLGGFVMTPAACAESGNSQAQQCTVVINKADNSLKLYGPCGELLGRYPVATGLYQCTVEGVFRVADKHVVSESGRGQFGTHWIGLNTRGRRGWKQVGIHGTNEPASVGKYASLGCVRMRNEDIARIYPLVAIGSKVQIVSVAPSSEPVVPPPSTAPPPAPVPVPAPNNAGTERALSLQVSRALLLVPLLFLLLWVVFRPKRPNGQG